MGSAAEASGAARGRRDHGGRGLNPPAVNPIPQRNKMLDFHPQYFLYLNYDIGYPSSALTSDFPASLRPAVGLLQVESSWKADGCIPFFGRAGCRRLKADANALLAARCCFEKNRRSEIIDWRDFCSVAASQKYGCALMTWQTLPFPTGHVEIELGSASGWLVGAIQNSWYYPRTRPERKYSRA